MINNDKLLFFWENNLNVLLTGEHGIGKTTIIKNFATQHEISALFFSGATLDPWIDFIGIPKERQDEKGVYLDIVPPKKLRDDEIQLIVMDELNRAPKNVRNALMELIQFRSINGRKFNNLRAVWAAINPETEDNVYDVERLDAALKDRFEIHINLPYKCDVEYFTKKFGSEVAKLAISWWNALPNDIKKEVSPRRLDYALNIFNLAEERGSEMIQHVIPESANINKLLLALSEGVPLDRLKDLISQKRFLQIEEFLAYVNNFDDCKDWIFSSVENINLLADYIPSERLTEEIVSSKNRDRIISLYHESSKVSSVCDTLLKGQNLVLKREINKNIPFAPFVKIGTLALEDPTIGIQCGTSDFAAQIRQWQDYNKLKNISPQLFYSTIRQGLSDSLPNKTIRETLVVLSRQIKFHFPNTLLSRKDDIFPSLNYCLKRLSIDVRTNVDYKLMINKLWKADLDKHVWIPN